MTKIKIFKIFETYICTSHKKDKNVSQSFYYKILPKQRSITKLIINEINLKVNIKIENKKE